MSEGRARGTTEVMAWRIATLVLLIYGILFFLGVGATFSPRVEEWLLEREDMLLVLATTGVVCNLVVWMLSVIVLGSGVHESRRYARAWTIILLLGNLLASLVFLATRRRRA